MEGIITFRGDNFRNTPFYGISNIQNEKLEKIWEFTTTTGSILDKTNLGANIESSPAIFEDYIVVATRGGKIFGVKIK